jgi:hypothetical protein
VVRASAALIATDGVRLSSGGSAQPDSAATQTAIDATTITDLFRRSGATYLSVGMA